MEETLKMRTVALAEPGPGRSLDRFENARRPRAQPANGVQLRR